jgi:murein peptide amidase A
VRPAALAALAGSSALAVLALGATLGGSASADVPQQQVIGHSVRGKPITATQVGDPLGTRVALVVGVIHGDERAGLRIVEALRRDATGLQGLQLWLITTVNPDGANTDARKNAHGVDLNRNFPFRWRGGLPHSDGYYPGPHPASEPETRAMMSFVGQIHPNVSVWYHQPWHAVLACHGRPRLGAEYAKLVGMGTSCRGKGLRGTAITWEMHVLPGSTAFVVELPHGRISGAAAERHARAVLSVAGGG